MNDIMKGICFPTDKYVWFDQDLVNETSDAAFTLDQYLRQKRLIVGP